MVICLIRPMGQVLAVLADVIDAFIEIARPRPPPSRRPDVRLHRGTIQKWIELRGLPVTRPSVIASDLLGEREDPAAVGHIIAEAIREAHDYPGTFADALAPHATAFGLRPGDGLGLLRWLLDLVGDPETSHWMGEARAHVARTGSGDTSPVAGARERAR